jgi:hypothetical protein
MMSKRENTSRVATTEGTDRRTEMERKTYEQIFDELQRERFKHGAWWLTNADLVAIALSRARAK